MNIRTRKAKKRRLILGIFFFTLIFLIIFLADKMIQINTIKKYIFLRFNYDYEQMEDCFYERYSLFDEDLKKRELSNIDNERNRQRIIKLKQSSSIRKYSIIKAKLSDGKPTYIIDVSFAITEETNGIAYNGNFLLEFVLSQIAPFKYKISEIRNITNEHE